MDGWARVALEFVKKVDDVTVDVSGCESESDLRLEEVRFLGLGPVRNNALKTSLKFDHPSLILENNWIPKYEGGRIYTTQFSIVGFLQFP